MGLARGHHTHRSSTGWQQGRRPLVNDPLGKPFHSSRGGGEWQPRWPSKSEEATAVQHSARQCTPGTRQTGSTPPPPYVTFTRKLPKGCVTGALGSILKQPLGSVAWRGGCAASVLWAAPLCRVTARGGENKGVGAKITSGESGGPSPLPHGHKMTWPVLSP